MYFTEFEKLLLLKQNPVGSSILLLLTWIALSDNYLDEREVSDLYKIAEASNHNDEIVTMISLVRRNDIESIQLASEIIRINISEKNKNLFMEMAIGISISDGEFKVTENYILRYIADLLGIGPTELTSIFYDITNRKIPEPEDISSYTYWNNFRENEKRENSEQSSSASDNAKVRAFAILGLDESSSVDEIKITYRRLVQVHHPDKFVVLGEEAVQAATTTFNRINNAYNYLLKNA